jgi:excisionase family DNA binding protein
MIQSPHQGDNGMDIIYTVEEAAEKLKVSTFTIREYLKSGKIKGFKIGNGWRIKESELEAFVDQMTKES